MTAAEMKLFGRDVARLVRWSQLHQKPVGYKKGVADTKENAREAIAALRLKNKLYDRNKVDAANIVLTFVPREFQGRFLNRVAKARTPRDMEKILEAVSKWVEHADKKEATRDFKKFMKKAQTTYRDGKTKLGKMRVEVRNAFESILDDFDMAKLSDAKREQLERRADYLHRVAANVETIFSELQKDMEAGDMEGVKNYIAMGQRRREEVERIHKTPISDLGADDIRDMQRVLEHLLDVMDEKGAVRDRVRSEHLGKAAVGMTQETVDKLHPHERGTGLSHAAGWMVGPGASTLHTLAKRVAGKDAAVTEQALHYAIRDARIRSHALFVEFLNAWRDRVKAAKISNADLEKLNELATVTLGGKEIEIAYGDLLSIYANMMADGGNLDALLATKGLHIITYRDKVERLKGLWRTAEVIETGTPTLEELRAIAKMIPDAHKALLDIHFEVNRTHQAQAINNTSIRMENYEKAIYPKYWHIVRWFPGKAEGGTVDVSMPTESAGRYFARRGGTGHMRIRPFMVEVIDGMQTDSLYGSAQRTFGSETGAFDHISFVEAIEYARTLTANPIWQAKIRAAGGKGEVDEIIRMLRAIQGLMTDQNVLDQAAGEFLANTAKSILGAKLSAAAIQVASLPAAFKFVEAKYFSLAQPP
ncbi:MAG TPA: hypothetical protein VM223_18515, partial [Planctomycetota bacterium]|nr:hypothetical protein [Planctomycetota bacterium]